MPPQVPTSLPRRFVQCYQPFRRPFRLHKRQQQQGLAPRAIPHPATEVRCLIPCPVQRAPVSKLRGERRDAGKAAKHRCCARPSCTHPHPRPAQVPRLDSQLDDALSNRPLELDPAGYFIIFVDRGARQIVAQHFSNLINKDGGWAARLTGQ